MMFHGSTEEEERRKRRWFSQALKEWQGGAMTRRSFVHAAFLAGFGALLPSLLGCRRLSGEKAAPSPEEVAATLGPDSVMESPEIRAFLKEMGRRFKGTRLRIVSEDTPPSMATRRIMEEEFIPLTGLEVEWELLPLDRVLARITADTGRQNGQHDVFYVDQQWVARFAEEMVDLQTLFPRHEIAYPGYNFPDILPELVRHLATYGNRLVGIPYDITINLLLYRRDILESLGLPIPTTRPEFLEAALTVTRDKALRMFGTSGMWRSGHLALYIEFVSLLWAHGGSVYLANGQPALNDAQALNALQYLQKLGNVVSPAATRWDWGGEAESFMMGESAFLIQPGEYLSIINDPRRSRVAGLVEAAPCPRAVALRPAKACGFFETPGVSHQGGSLLSISRYSRHLDAAWVFVQWATSADVTSRACILGGGTSPIRTSNYSDPRVVALSRTITGPTRHFPIALDAIRHDMGSDPKLPAFPDIAVHGLAVELGKLTTGQQSITATAEAMQRAAQLEHLP